MRSRWWGPIARIRSLERTRSRVRLTARCSLRSIPRSIATSSAPSDAGPPSQALVPALLTSTSESPRSIATLRASASAIGLRQVLPVQTNRIFTCPERSEGSAFRWRPLSVPD